MMGYDFLAWAEQRMAQSHLYRTLGIALETVGAGSAVAQLRVDELHCNISGFVQGGIYGVLADMCLGFAARSLYEPDQGYATLELATSYLGASRSGERLRCSAHVVKSTKRLVWTEGLITASDGNETGRQVARSRSLGALTD